MQMLAEHVINFSTYLQICIIQIVQSVAIYTKHKKTGNIMDDTLIKNHSLKKVPGTDAKQEYKKK